MLTMVFAKAGIAPRVSLAAAVLVLATASAQAQTTLRYKFKQGDTLSYGLEQKMEMKMNVGGMDITMDMKQNIAMKWKVLEVDQNGKARIAQKIDSIRMSMEAPPPVGGVKYDSRDGKEPEGPIGKVLGPVFNALAGAEFTLNMDARGEISDVKLPEKLAETLQKTAGGAPGLGDMFSPEGLKRLVTQGGLVLPEKAVKRGDTWAQTNENKMPFGMMKVTNTMTYEGPGGESGTGVQKIAVKPVVSLEPDPNAQVSMKIKATDAKGTALFDNTTGRLVEMSTTQNMQMQISAAGQDITLNIRTTTSLKLDNKGG